MTPEAVLFWIFATCTVLAAIVVVSAKSPMSSAMALVATFFFLAGLYVLLWAHTVAVLQVVRVVERVGRLLHHAGDEAKVEPALLLGEPAEQREERDALQVLHDDVELAFGLAKLEHLGNIERREVLEIPNAHETYSEDEELEVAGRLRELGYI